MKSSKATLILACSLTILLTGAGSTLAAPPINDNCSNATAVGNVTKLAFSTTEATFDGPGYYITSANIWYLYTATCTGCATISLCDSSYDTKIAVYDGSSCTPAIEKMLKYNDDYCGKQSKVNVAVTAGQKYLIEVGGYDGWTGYGKLTISCSTQPCIAPNDDCANAMLIGDVIDFPFDTSWATFDGPGFCIEESPNLWYLYTATYTGDVTVSLCGSAYDTMLAVYDGYTCPPTYSQLIECNDDTLGHCGFDSEITFAAIAGNDYLIEVGGIEQNYNRDFYGLGVITVTSGGEASNDNCQNALPVGIVTNLPFDTTLATFDGQGDCMYSPNIWYLFTAPCTGNATISLCGSSFDTVLAVYNTSECPPLPSEQLACNDDACGQQSQLTIPVVAGNQYLIEVGGYGTNTGQGQLSISVDCLSNDDCQNAQPIGDVTNQPFDTTTATFDGPGSCMYSPNVWYLYTATCTGNVTVSLCGSSFDTMLAVYEGSNCPPTSGQEIACNDDSCGLQSQITFAVTAGEQYLIEVGGYGSNTGQGVITITSDCIPVIKTDLGDAPDSTNNYATAMTAYPKGGPAGVQANFPTVFNDGSGLGPYGPIHLNSTLVAHLGLAVSSEQEADTGFDEDIVNNILPPVDQPDKDKKDDGVIFPVNMPHCDWSTFDCIVNVINPNTDLWINVWCDWNRDGDWDDDSNTDQNMTCSKGFVSEWAVQNQFLFNLPVGLNQITTKAFLPWHSDTEEIWMRITLSEKPWKGGSNPGETGNGGSGPQSGYDIGETEDYYFTPKTDCSMCEDLNEDGVINTNDLSILMDRWIDECL